MIGYDKLAVNSQMLLDLPFREGIGAVTRDVSKAHHQDVSLINTPTWTSISSGLGVLELDGTNQYLELANADCLDLDFIAGDYSLAGWIYWTHNAANDDQNVIGRYEVDVSGWELYLYDDPNYYLTLRHHHSLTCTPGPPIACRTGCYSAGWTQDTWHFIGISRSGVAQLHYRNGVVLPTSCAGGLTDPESCAQDLVLGTRFSKDDNWVKGKMQGMRGWDRALSATEWLQIFNREKHWYNMS